MARTGIRPRFGCFGMGYKSIRKARPSTASRPQRPGAIDRALRGGEATLAEIIQRYLDEYARIRPLGKTKQATLHALRVSWLGGLSETQLTSQKLVEFAQWRMSAAGGGVQAQTVGNDLSHLGAVLSVARPAWGYEIDPHAMSDARAVLGS